MGPQCKWRKLPAGWNAGVAFPAARHRTGLRELRGAARPGRPAGQRPSGTVTAGPAVAAGPLGTRAAANGPRRLSGTGRPLALGLRLLTRKARERCPLFRKERCPLLRKERYPLRCLVSLSGKRVCAGGPSRQCPQHPGRARLPAALRTADSERPAVAMPLSVDWTLHYATRTHA